MGEQPNREQQMLEMIFRNVRANASAQLSAEYRENYFRSCEAHGGQLAEVVKVVRLEFLDK